METIFWFIAIVIVAIIFLKQFDKIAGRGPKQVKDGLKEFKKEQ